jgi:transcriptional regulator with XRE-family HTH domain
MKDLSERLIALRAGSSRREFARKLGITESTLRNYEKGASIPDAQFLAEICKKLQISPEWMLLGSGSMHATESVYEQTATLCESLQGECQRCSKLERDLDVEKKERRELAVDNRRLYREKEELLRENSALREQLARLEAASTKKSPQRCAEMDGDGVHDIRSAVETLPHCAEKRAIASK